MRGNTQAGFGLVEVLISIAVISAVLLGAYAVTQRSTLAVRDSQEHAEVTQLLQGQTEYIRSLALAQDNDINGIYQAGDFCIDADTPSGPERKPSSDTACNNLQERYDIKASYKGEGVFKIVGSWDTIKGSKGSEQISYRVYPEGYTTP